MLTPVLFLPGLLCDASLWRPAIDDLKDLIAPAVADLTLDDTIGSMARRALAAAPERFALAALSMGGYVAFEIMRQSPHRVTRLALIGNCGHLPPLESPAEAGAFLRSWLSLPPRSPAS